MTSTKRETTEIKIRKIVAAPAALATSAVLLRRSLVLTLGRPVSALLLAVGVLAIAAGYVMLPGLGAVFGLMLAAFLTTQYLWGSGILAAAPATPSEA